MSFNTILIPTDFTVNTEVAIQKGIELCEGPNPSIHLLHVPQITPESPFGYYRYLTSYPFNDTEESIRAANEKLYQWRYLIEQARHDVATFGWIPYNVPISKAIEQKARRINADLIIIGKNSQHSLLPWLNTVIPSHIAKQTNISVLTVKPGSLSSPLRTVVVPIGTMFPEKKVEIINSLGNKYFIHIRLLILVRKGDDTSKLQTSLINIYRRLKNRSLDNISYDMLQTTNKGWDILNYCRKVDADLLIVHPESETRIGWFNKHISDELPTNSKTQILAVAQNSLSVV